MLIQAFIDIFLHISTNCFMSMALSEHAHLDLNPETWMDIY